MRLPGIADPYTNLTSDDWYTPPYIIKALGLTYDLDPCAPPGGVPWIPATNHYTEADDGLFQPWHGLVWLNPPYSKPAPWVHRLAEHGNGIAIVALDPTAPMWELVFNQVDLICALRSRVTFIQPDNANVTSARFPSVLIPFGDTATDAVRHCQLGHILKPLAQ